MSQVSWASSGPGSGSGRFVLRDAAAAGFVGFAKGPLPIDLGDVIIERLDTPFAALLLAPAAPGETIRNSAKLLLSATARGGATGMKWDAARKTVGTHWGEAPPLIEGVKGTVRVAGDKPLKCYALAPDGKRGNEVPTTFRDGATTIMLGSETTLWYELVR